MKRTRAPLTVARHGETTWSATGRFQGLADPPLTAVGQQEARKLAEVVGGRGVRVWTSDLRRARDTADAFASRGAQVHIDERLREVDVGQWEGLTREQVSNTWPAQYAAWLKDPTLPVCGREPWGLTQQRCREIMHDLASEAAAEGRVVLVTHSTIGLALVAAFTGSPPSEVDRSYAIGHGEFLELYRRHPSNSADKQSCLFTVDQTPRTVFGR